jgi:hypothetical protein
MLKMIKFTTAKKQTHLCHTFPREVSDTDPGKAKWKKKPNIEEETKKWQ